MPRQMKIQTAFGPKIIDRRIGAGKEYYHEIPGPSAPNGAWWTLNPQTGFVPVASNSRALLFAISENSEA